MDRVAGSSDLWTCPSGEHTFRASDVGRFRDRHGQVKCPSCEGDNLNKGPLYGAIYGLVAVLPGIAAWLTSGVVSTVLAIVAGVLALIAVWIILFTGGMLALVKALKRSSGNR